MDHVQTLHNALNPEIWRSVGRALLAKMLSELMYEQIIVPDKIEERGGLTMYRFELRDGVDYSFVARRRLFDSYRVIPESIERGHATARVPADDPLQFVLDISETVDMTPQTTAHLLKELNATLIADAHISARKAQDAPDVREMDYHEVEGEMEGHPWIIFNKGRIGFGYDDYLAYAPERKKAVSLSWLAVRKDRATYSSVPGLGHETLMHEELGSQTLAGFRTVLTGHGLKPESYYFLPVHEWQWKNIVVPHFPGELAAGRIVPLGEGPHQYLPQQSIRTFLNLTDPRRHSVKLPMSILNTLVYRGLPGERTVIAPRVTEWVKGIRDRDPFLRDECRLILLGEVASLNYDHPYYRVLSGAPYRYLEMLGCIWRESITAYVESDERPVTLASLLHVDSRGRPFVSTLVERSGLSLEAWVERLFDTVLPPLLHYLYQYGTVFSPHGENAILVLNDNVPRRLAMKDFVDDVNISQQPLPELESLPDDLASVLLREPPEGLCQFILAGLFICHLRYLADLLEEHHGYPEHTFWTVARETILRYQARFPKLRERYHLFDLLTPSFPKLCLNRTRMIEYGYADDGERPHAAEFGRVTNALSRVGKPAER